MLCVEAHDSKLSVWEMDAGGFEDRIHKLHSESQAGLHCRARLCQQSKEKQSKMLREDEYPNHEFLS